MIDASLIIDAVADPGPRGVAARDALAKQPAAERLFAPGHFAFEVMSGLAAAGSRPDHPFRPEPERLRVTAGRGNGSPWTYGRYCGLLTTVGERAELPFAAASWCARTSWSGGCSTALPSSRCTHHSFC